MAKARNQFEVMASEAAERIDRARAAGEQLDLLPPEPDTAGLLAEGAGRGTGSGRGKGKATAQLREWLALRGFRQPEEALAEMAGLATGQDAFMVAMQRTEQLLLWAYGHDQARGKDRLALFQQLYAAQLRALDALLPYGLAKVTPDAAPVQAVQVVVQGGGGGPQQPAPGPDGARDVTPGTGRIAPPPMPVPGPVQSKQNQGVMKGDAAASDGE